jgi:hypothetical protein
MLRKLVRFYYRLRYFPRHIFSALTDINNGISRVSVAVTRIADNADNADALRVDTTPLTESLCRALGEIVQEIGEFRDSASIALFTLHRRVMSMEESIARLSNESRHEANIASSRAAATDEAVARLSNESRHEANIASSRAAATDEAVARLGSEIRREAEITDRLDQFLRLQARVFPSWMWSPAASARVRSVLSLLRPWAAQGMEKIRIGRDFDGGYVMLDDFGGVTRALSLGISDDVSWDSDIAERTIPVLQFDQTVAAPPVEHALFKFETLKIAPVDDSASVSIGSILRTRVPESGDTLLLKMDIEGAEWEICVGLADDVLRRFKQIVCEFHELDRLAEEAFADRARRVFEKLTGTHFVCHVHGNNCANFANVANVPVPQTLEVTFASRACYTPEPTAETFPTSLDRPNEPGRADLYLGRFHFEA